MARSGRSPSRFASGERHRAPAPRPAATIGLDTNIVVRYLAQDDSVQSPLATEIMERRPSEENPGFISILAIVEPVWVLDHAYAPADNAIAAAVERMVQANTLVVENEQEVFTAMIALKEGRGTFADALIGALGPRVGCTRTLTFDKAALALPGFELA